MARIKVYKGGGGTMIPVEEAKLATAYRCPWTNSMFSTKKGYVNHLKELRKDHIHVNIRRAILARQKEDLWSQPTFEDVISWIERHPEFFFDNAVGLRGQGRQDRVAAYRDKFWIRITYLDLTWDNQISNTHSCPRGGTTNWGGRDTWPDKTPKPRGYPGWGGRIEYQLSHDLGFGSDVMRGVGINTGSGGGINDNRYGYDVKFFDDDWPGMEKDRVFKILSQNESWKKFRYGQPRYFR